MLRSEALMKKKDARRVLLSTLNLSKNSHLHALK